MNMPFASEEQMEAVFVDFLNKEIEKTNEDPEYHQEIFLDKNSVILRQQNLNGYGIADVILIQPESFFKDGEEEMSTHLSITLFELKNREIKTSDYEQLTRYRRAIYAILEDIGYKEAEIFCYLIGTEEARLYSNHLIYDDEYINHGIFKVDSNDGCFLDLCSGNADWIITNFNPSDCDLTIEIKNAIEDSETSVLK
jgi:hypothetical protein